jgi:radical SAM superfamily enzyme YgiQ (UPF0313 family)
VPISSHREDVFTPAHIVTARSSGKVSGGTSGIHFPADIVALSGLRCQTYNFYDDLFTLNRKRVEELCLRLSSSRIPVTFNCIVRIGHIDPQLIALLKKGGCWMVSVGIESGDQEPAGYSKDGLSIESIRRDVQLLHDSGLWVKGLFMIGFPGEKEESIVKTGNWLFLFL